MSEKQNGGFGSSSQPHEDKDKISQHRKSIDISSSKIKKQQRSLGKNNERTGAKHDDWNDPAGNSHIKAGKK
jgi:hypothetical protein